MNANIQNTQNTARELSLAELEAEMAAELPEREEMSRFGFHHRFHSCWHPCYDYCWDEPPCYESYGFVSSVTTVTSVTSVSELGF